MTVMEYHMKDFKLAGTVPALELLPIGWTGSGVI
jgi:hypothetical protein